MFAILCFSLVGCAGSDPDEPDWETGISLEGVKVLRKPLSYSFDENVPENDGTTDFYYTYATDIVAYLFYTYGNFNTDPDYGGQWFSFLYQKTQNAQVGELAEQFAANPDGFVYFYDAIRHQVTSVQQDVATGSYAVSADTSRAWNWSLPIDNINYKPWVLAYQGKQSGNIISTTFYPTGNYSFTYSGFNFYYIEGGDIQYTFDPTAFQSAYVNQDYIRGLTYAIYSLVLGLEPAAMSVDYSSGSPVLSVEGYAATADQTSAEVALANVKLLFNQLGSYVGLVRRGLSS